MKKYLEITLILFFSLNIQAQDFKTSQDSIRFFYDNLFEVMKNGYLFREKVDWKEIETKINNE